MYTLVSPFLTSFDDALRGSSGPTFIFQFTLHEANARYVLVIIVQLQLTFFYFISSKILLFIATFHSALKYRNVRVRMRITQIHLCMHL